MFVLVLLYESVQENYGFINVKEDLCQLWLLILFWLDVDLTKTQPEVTGIAVRNFLNQNIKVGRSILNMGDTW